MVLCGRGCIEMLAMAAQIYCDLARLGAGMRIIDVGGGLGIDYDGSHSAFSDMSVAFGLEEYAAAFSDMSVAFGLEEYAAAVVRAVQYACDRKHVGHSESGRALISHHSILIFEAVSATTAEPASIKPDLAYILKELADDARADYRSLMAAAMCGEDEACRMYADQLKRRCRENFKDSGYGRSVYVEAKGVMVVQYVDGSLWCV